MSLDLEKAESRPVSSTQELVDHFRRAERPAAGKVGLEHEKLVYTLDGQPVAYEGERGIGALLGQLARRGYRPYREEEGGPVIALMREGLTVSLEPGGQLELSGSPWSTARQAHAENLAHLADVKAACEELGLMVVALGHRPFVSTAKMPWMPKHRYAAMRRVLPRRGGLALNMMLMTATGQVSLDWASESDCARKVSLAARVNPLLVALYANSPIVEGRPTGYLSFRSHVWTDVDPARCGLFPAMVEGELSYRAYVEWALDAPLLFLRRQGKYLHPTMTFRELLARGFEGQPATESDWIDHLSTMFPEVRMKTVIEIRGADCVDAELTGALPALYRGLFYDEGALGAALALLPKLSFAEHQAFTEEARRKGLRGELRGKHLAAYAQELIAIAREGLRRIDRDDAALLDPLEAVAQSGRSPAERVLEVFEKTPEPKKLLSAFQL